MALNGLICAEVPLRNYSHSLTHSLTQHTIFCHEHEILYDNTRGRGTCFQGVSRAPSQGGGAPASPKLLGPLPRADSDVESIDPLCFLAGCLKSQLIQALCVLSLSMGFLSAYDFFGLVYSFTVLLCVCLVPSPTQYISYSDGTI